MMPQIQFAVDKYRRILNWPVQMTSNRSALYWARDSRPHLLLSGQDRFHAMINKNLEIGSRSLMRPSTGIIGIHTGDWYPTLLHGRTRSRQGIPMRVSRALGMIVLELRWVSILFQISNTNLVYLVLELDLYFLCRPASERLPIASTPYVRINSTPETARQNPVPISWE